MPELSKVILFGGTFDPIHKGHLEVAQHALRTLAAERLVFVPAHRSPHKRLPHAEGADRMAMIVCSIRQMKDMCVTDCELLRTGPSYTFDTVSSLKKQSPETNFYWLIGADQLDELPRWYRIHELLGICHISTMVRSGYPEPEMNRFRGAFGADVIEQLRQDVVRTPLIPINSTEIRRELAARRMPHEQLPECVSEYIRIKGLYGFKQSG